VLVNGGGEGVGVGVGVGDGVSVMVLECFYVMFMLFVMFSL